MYDLDSKSLQLGLVLQSTEALLYTFEASCETCATIDSSNDEALSTLRFVPSSSGSHALTGYTGLLNLGFKFQI